MSHSTFFALNITESGKCKVSLVLNDTPRHADVWGEQTAIHGDEWLASPSSRFNPRGQICPYQLDRGLNIRQRRSRRSRETTNPLDPLEIESRSLARSLLTTSAELLPESTFYRTVTNINQKICSQWADCVLMTASCQQAKFMYHVSRYVQREASLSEELCVRPA